MRYRFLIYISHTYALPIGEPLQNEIRKRGFEVKWFSELDEPKKFFPEAGDLLLDIRKVISYEPHIVLTITDVVADFIPGLKVQIFHGFLANKHSFKKGHFRIRGFFDLYCTQGPSTTSIFKEIQKTKPHFQVQETGWSKVDPLFQIPEQPRRKPTILVSSTFSPKYSWTYHETVINELERISKTGKYKFLVVLHPKMAADKIAKIKSIQHTDFEYIETPDIIPLFRQADIMFSDTTSAITEFMLQKKPVVTFRNNKPSSHLIDITDASGIKSAIEHAFNPSEILAKAIEDYVNFTHPYFDGESSGRVIDACINFLHEDKKKFKLKPLNLVRRFKIRRQLNYFSLRSYREMPYTPKD
ncbi:CDP-glycerol glycerophosphotransferase [Christiangramia sp. OXR-203]|jgi:CDP-glycerol glycerophosphotransferase (TagB/SpsB family)|uniref:CDP-glycerol glycerophosphotransferase n=1 Tax=Christiangramia sp. OXR-203 TaxID=3100176 RepID=UPI002AC9EE01|nr:CDP-glycerol glycerophosphotransferase [Christiangramia sp. OXR-203]WPY99490.1 CDP-glycerol glycerophosphotransferase [Christiangramia sp. OXR-203]|tara:strand:- start:888 stop:1958 length:1071 start_codon:yes stop_codon:yes gene_type:complete